MLTKPITLAGTATPTAGGGTTPSAGTSGVDYASMTRTERAQAGLTAQEQAQYSIASEYDLNPNDVNALWDPGSVNEGNKYAMAGGSDPKIARNPIWLRQQGDRLPTSFEMANPWAYDAKREPIIGNGGETLDPNNGDPAAWDKWLNAGYVPPSGTPAYKAFADALSSKGETLNETIQRMELTGSLGQTLQVYPSGLTQVTNKDAIPQSNAMVYNPPAYRTTQNADGTTSSTALSVGWDGKPAGWTVQSDIATSPKNVVATSGPGIADDPNFVPTKNPPYWILPNGTKVKSVPGSTDVIGFNGETWKWEIKPEELGANTTWDMISRNPITGELDLSMVTREAAQKAQELGILPTEYQNLITDAPSRYDTPGANTSTPIGITAGSNPPPPPAPAPKPKPKPVISTTGTNAGTSEMYAQPKSTSPGQSLDQRDPGSIGTNTDIGQQKPPIQPAPKTAPVGGIPGGASGQAKPIASSPISLPRMTAL